MTNYLCISGQMRSGKNVTGDYICKKLNYTEASFAKPVKDIFCQAFGVDLNFVEEWKVKKENPPGFQKTVRETLQFIGDGFRNSNSNVWVDYAFKNNKIYSCYTDGRYVNELIRIRKEGGINILLRRPDYENECENESEAQIRRLVDWFVSKKIEGNVRHFSKENAPEGCFFVDFFIVNDGSVQDLYSKIDKFVIPEIKKD